MTATIMCSNSGGFRCSPPPLLHASGWYILLTTVESDVLLSKITKFMHIFTNLNHDWSKLGNVYKIKY